MSEKVDSNTTNSLSSSKSPAADGMATALLMIERGIANNVDSAVSRPVKELIRVLTKKILSTNMTRAAVKPLNKVPIFSFLICNSKAPSRTIRINPIVPSTGISCLRISEPANPYQSAKARATIPVPSNNKTEGNLVLREKASNRYEKMISRGMSTNICLLSIFGLLNPIFGSF